MNRLVIYIACMGLSSTAFAQDLNPALEGSGQQAQSLELLGGSVSVSVESAGSLSLNRGDDSLDGSLSVTVNDVTVGVSSPRDANPDPVSTTPQSNATSATPAPPRPSTQSPNEVAIDTSNIEIVGDGTVCETTSATDGELAQALGQGFSIVVRPASCESRDDSVAVLLAQQQALTDRLASAGIASVEVISITIEGRSVIVDYASRD